MRNIKIFRDKGLSCGTELAVCVRSVNKKECEGKHKKLSTFAGILKKVTTEPLEYQKELRSEWD